MYLYIRFRTDRKHYVYQVLRGRTKKNGFPDSVLKRMPERTRAKRKTAVDRDDVRHAETLRELERSKKRYKDLHVLTCKKAGEIIALKNQVRVLEKHMRDLCGLVLAESQE